jgi:cytochrome b561
MALFIIGMIAVGWYMHSLPRNDDLKNTLVGLHKSFGALILILFFVRVFLRFATKIPPLPKTIPPIERKLAHLGHGILYILIGIVPFSGYAMSNLHGSDVNLFGIKLPRLFLENKEFAHLSHEAHEILPYILLAIIIIHIAAVIKHRFFEKPQNNVLKRML